MSSPIGRGFACLLALAFLAGCGGPPPEPGGVAELRDLARGKNLVVVLLDAGAFGHFGFAGYERNTTPHIDALAAQSLVFETAYSPAASTGHTVYSMLTSTYPFLGEKQGLKGIKDAAFRITDETHLMPELLEPRFPHRSGLSANQWFGAAFRFDDGFNYFYESWDASVVPDTTAKRAQRIVDLFRRDLDAWGDGPAFSYVHFLEPHTPYTPPDPYLRMFDPVAADSIDATARAVLQYRTVYPGPERAEWTRALYDANLAYADAKVGELVEELRERGEWDDTVFLLIADHGEAFWQHGVYGHGRHVYEEFVRIPFLMRIPGASQLAGTRISEPVSLVDLLPTFLDLFELPPSPDQKGDSLLPLIAGHAEGFADRMVYLRNTHGTVPEFGLRSGRYKWIYRVYEGSYQLYDLVEDPGEKHDLNAAGRVPPEAAKLKPEIALWIATGTERIEPVEEIDPETMERLRAIGYF